MAYDNLTTLDKVKGWLRDTSGKNDGALNMLIEQVSELIGRFLGRDNLGTVGSYAETYRLPRPAFTSFGMLPQLILRRWPVVAVTSVVVSGRSLPILTDISSGATPNGVWLEDDRRTLLYIGGGWGLSGWPSGMVVPTTLVSYTAGYDPGSIPPGLSQAANQWIGEITKSADWIGYRTKAIHGESVSFDVGSKWGMSPRTLSMLQPYRDRVPWSGAL